MWTLIATYLIFATCAAVAVYCALVIGARAERS